MTLFLSYLSFFIFTAANLVRFGICDSVFSIALVLIWLWMVYNILLIGVYDVIALSEVNARTKEMLDPVRLALQQIKELQEKKGLSFSEALDELKRLSGETLPDWFLEVLKSRNQFNKQ